MPKQTILWIVLPKKLDPQQGRAQVSAFVSPRLEPDAGGTLGQFDFVDWPARLLAGNVHFEVEVDGRRVAAKMVTQPESAKWRALFQDSTFVRPHQPDAPSPVFGSYSAGRLHDQLKAGYQTTCANSPVDVSPIEVVTSAFPDLHASFGPPPQPGGDTLLAGLTEREQRITLARRLFRQGAASFSSRVEQLVTLAQDESETTRDVRKTAAFVPIVPDAGKAVDPFAQFAVFHSYARGERGRTTLTPGDDRADFHQMLTTLSEYPEVMRALGLVIDLEFDTAELSPATFSAPGSLRVIPDFLTPLADGTIIRTPATAYVFDGGRKFGTTADPASPDEEFVDGLLNLRLEETGSATPPFQFVQVDVDGAARSTLDLMRDSSRAARDGADSRPDFGLPPLRTSGVSVVRRGNAESLHGAISNGLAKLEKIAAGEDVRLFTEDLLRGYRIDVRDGTSKKWRSLHARDGVYRFPGLAETLEISDEGSIQPSMVQPESAANRGAIAPLDPAAPNYVSESLFLWRGWSLSAARPGEELPQPKAAPAPGVPSTPSPAPAPPAVRATFTATKTSLPRLRFGEKYEVRARLADLAGNSLTLADADEIVAAIDAAGDIVPMLPQDGETFRFLRFEVIASPVVVPPSGDLHKDPVERILLRSNHDTTPDAYSTLHPEYKGIAERHIAPPKTSQLMAEMSGFFDRSLGPQRDLKRTYELAVREKGSLADVPVSGAAALSVPWLPDPLAGGAAFRNLPGVAAGTLGRLQDNRLEFTQLPLTGAKASEIGSLVLIGFGEAAAWPEVSSLRLRLAEGTGAPEWNAAERILTVFLPKGESRTVRIACHLRDDTALRLLGIWKWMVEWLDGQIAAGTIPASERPARFEEFRQLSLLGLWWMLTPYRELELVHAVQQPVEEPVILSLSPLKIRNNTFAYLRGQARVHGASTGRLDLTASWTEQVDGGPPRQREAHLPGSSIDLSFAPAATKTNAAVPAARFDPATNTVTYLGPDVEAFDQHLRGLGDQLSEANGELSTAIRRLRPPRPQFAASVTAIKSGGVGVLILRSPLEATWPELLARVEASAKVAEAISPVDPDAPHSEDFPFALDSMVKNIADLLRGIAADARTGIQALEIHQGRHEFGDTKHRSVTYRAIATTRYAECFTPGGALTMARVSAPVTVDILSSAPPSPPGVQYVVPAFSWERTATPGTGERRSARRGGALRVYLDRPWFSSGDGELLAVVLGSRPGNGMFTQWGRDPLWRSPATSRIPTAADFRNAETSGADRVAYRVNFDGEQCFCDIEIDPGPSYFPFIRLALARFQPKSVPGAEMSPVVLADFVQLAPHRAAAIVRQAADTFTVTVTGRTHESLTNAQDGGTRKGTFMQVSVQERIPGTSDDAGWLPADDRATVTPETDAPAGDLLWKGRVAVAAQRKPGQFRILIEEVETYLGLDPTFTPAAEMFVHRVTFAETFELD